MNAMEGGQVVQCPWSSFQLDSLDCFKSLFYMLDFLLCKISLAKRILLLLKTTRHATYVKQLSMLKVRHETEKLMDMAKVFVYKQASEGMPFLFLCSKAAECICLRSMHILCFYPFKYLVKQKHQFTSFGIKHSFVVHLTFFSDNILFFLKLDWQLNLGYQ